MSSRKRRRDGMAAGVNGQRENVNRPNARNRLSKRTYDHEKDRSHIRVTANDDADDVAQELVRVLGEPEHMKDMFGNLSKQN